MMRYSETELTIKDKTLDIEGKIYGEGPVQAEGTVKGKAFYFRARGDEWTFSLAEGPDIDPVDIQVPQNSSEFGFFREAIYGEPGGYDASYIPPDEVKSIIRKCVIEYLLEKEQEERKNLFQKQAE